MTASIIPIVGRSLTFLEAADVPPAIYEAKISFLAVYIAFRRSPHLRKSCNYLLLERL
jgi:hypothetical protein